MHIEYRVQQFWRALTVTPNPDDLAQAQKVLTPSMYKLFEGMHPSEQAHSLAIFHHLRAQNESNEDLLVAALLHDIGKSRFPLRIWERVFIVLGRALIPTQTAKWGQGEPYGWKRGFVVAQQHPKWGADMAASAGATPLTVSIIARHQDLIDIQQGANIELSFEDQLLVKLQAIDNTR